MFLNKNMYSLETRDFNDQQHILTDYYNLIFSKHYSDEGSGFGFIDFTLRRDTTKNYIDVEHGFKIILRKGVRTILFKGVITRIEESTNNELHISGVGLQALLSFDIYNRVIVDNRTNRWSAGCNPKGSYRPDKFDHTLSWTIVENEGEETEIETSYDGIQITPRKGVKYTEEDFYYLRYRFEFGEIAKALKGNYDLALPSNWPGKLTILDAEENVIYTSNVSGTGVFNLDLDANVDGSFIEIRFEATATGINTAEDETVYFRLWNIKVQSEDGDITATEVMIKLAEYMEDNFDFSDDTSQIFQNDYIIPQAAYEDRRLNEIATEVSKYGTSLLEPIAWGVTFDETDRLFLEKYPVTFITYKIRETDDYAVAGDVAQSYQKVYGKYVDAFGRTQRTDVYTDTEVIEALGGLYRKEVIELNDVTEDQIIQYIGLALDENSVPKVSTEFTITGFIFNETEGEVAIEDILPGKIVQVPEFKARESAVLDDKRSGSHTFLIKIVEINLDESKARLVPADNKASFETYMEQLKRLSK